VGWRNADYRSCRRGIGVGLLSIEPFQTTFLAGATSTPMLVPALYIRREARQLRNRKLVSEAAILRLQSLIFRIAHEDWKALR
jgi:hypothetical protein